VIFSAPVVLPAKESDSVGRGTALGFAGLDQTGLVGEHYGLDAVAKVELHQHVRDVGLHGGLAGRALGETRPSFPDSATPLSLV